MNGRDKNIMKRADEKLIKIDSNYLNDTSCFAVFVLALILIMKINDNFSSYIGKSKHSQNLRDPSEIFDLVPSKHNNKFRFVFFF